MRTKDQHCRVGERFEYGILTQCSLRHFFFASQQYSSSISVQVLVWFQNVSHTHDGLYEERTPALTTRMREMDLTADERTLTISLHQDITQTTRYPRKTWTNVT